MANGVVMRIPERKEIGASRNGPVRAWAYRKHLNHRDTEAQRRPEEEKRGEKIEDRPSGGRHPCAPRSSLLLFSVSLCLCGSLLTRQER
jgi:hypothetical protein